jgi:hypothetical protein
VVAADRDDRLGRLDHDDVPSLPKAGADTDNEVRVPVAGIRHDTNRPPILFLCAPAGCFHDTPKPSAHKGTLIPGEKMAGRLSCLVLLHSAVAGTDHRYLHGCIFSCYC